MEDWITIVVALLPIVSKIINKLTPRWDMVANKAVQICLLLIEALDVLRLPKDYKKGLKETSPLEKRIKEVMNGII